jgi:hypothetical protein
VCGTSLGLPSPSAHSGGGVYVFCQPGPPGQLRSVLRLSQPFDGLLLHLPSTPFDVVTLVGFSLQGFPLPNRSRSSSLPDYPLGVPPAGLRTLFLVKREPWARRSVPRMVHMLRLLSPTGSCSVRESVPCRNTVKFFCRSIPSWASSSLGFVPPRSWRIFTSAALVLVRLPLRPFHLAASQSIQTTAALQRSDFVGSAVSLSRPAPLLRFPAFQLLSSLG